MEARAKAVGKGGELYYISPNNNQWLHPDDAARAEALGLHDHLLEDFHVGGGGAVKSAENMFKAKCTPTLSRTRTLDLTTQFTLPLYIS